MSSNTNQPNTTDGTSPTSTQKKVISIQGNTVPPTTNTVTGTTTTTGTGTGTGTPGTTIGNAPAKAVGTGVPPKEATPQQDPNNIDIDKFISESTTEVKVLDEKEQKKLEIMKKLTKAIESINKTRRIVFNNSETQEFVGTKFQYVADEDGKTPYDYMNDEEVLEHIEFIVPEGDPQDGSPVDAPVTFFWIKPTF